MSIITLRGARWRAAWRSILWCFVGFAFVLRLPLTLSSLTAGGSLPQVMGALAVALIAALVISAVVGPIAAIVALSCDWSVDARRSCDLCGADLRASAGDQCPNCGSFCPETGQDLYAAHRAT